MAKKKKRGFKMPHLLYIILGLIVLMSILTYIVPAGQFVRDAQGNVDATNFQYLDHQTPISLLDVLFMFVTGLLNSGLVIWVVMISGANMAIILQTGAVDKFLNWAVYKLQKQSTKVLIPVLYFLILYLAAFASTDALIAVVPIGVVFAKKLNLDPMSALATTFFPSMIGFGLGPTMKVIVPQSMLGVPLISGFGLRFVLLNLFGLVGLFFAMRYVIKVQKDPTNSAMGNTKWLAETADNENIEKVETPTRSLIVLGLLILQYLILVIYSFRVGENIYEFIIGFFIVSAVFIGLVGGLSPDEVGNGFANGLGSMAFVTFVIGLASTMQLVMTEGNILDTIVYGLTRPLMGLNRGLSVVGITGIITILNPIVPSATAKAAVLIPIVEPMAATLGINQQIAVQSFLFGDAFTNMISPALGWTMGALEIADVPYDKWLKWVIKPLLTLIVLSLITIYFLDYINWTGM